MFASEMAKEQLQADAQQRKFERRQSLGGEAEVRLPLRVHAISRAILCEGFCCAVSVRVECRGLERVQPVLC